MFLRKQNLSSTPYAFLTWFIFCFVNGNNLHSELFGDAVSDLDPDLDSNVSHANTTDCPDQYYGDECTKECHVNCWGRLCNATTGYCFNCTGSNFGHFCQSEPYSSESHLAVIAGVGVATIGVALFVSIIVVIHQRTGLNLSWKPNYSEESLYSEEEERRPAGFVGSRAPDVVEELSAMSWLTLEELTDPNAAEDVFVPIAEFDEYGQFMGTMV